MNTIFILYDIDSHEIIRAYPTMHKGVAAAINRLVIFQNICSNIFYDNSYTIIEYIDTETGARRALCVEETDMDEEV